LFRIIGHLVVNGKTQHVEYEPVCKAETDLHEGSGMVVVSMKIDGFRGTYPHLSVEIECVFFAFI
jgi:hypothetical protein